MPGLTAHDANIIHWASVKSRRVTRSVLATPIPLTIFTDSKSLYDCLIKLGTTNEKRLMIDLMCLRQSYQRREITEVMEKCCNALKNMVDTNKLTITTNGWVESTI